MSSNHQDPAEYLRLESLCSGPLLSPSTCPRSETADLECSFRRCAHCCIASFRSLICDAEDHHVFHEISPLIKSPYQPNPATPVRSPSHHNPGEDFAIDLILNDYTSFQNTLREHNGFPVPQHARGRAHYLVDHLVTRPR